MINETVDLRQTGEWWKALPIIIFYTVTTTFGTCLSQYMAMHWIEKWSWKLRKPTVEVQRPRVTQFLDKWYKRYRQ